MITNAQYFGTKPHTQAQEAVAADLLERSNTLWDEYATAVGRGPDIDPDTGTEISGSKNGSGDGGFRLPTATTGRTLSSHKEARGLDKSDQDNGFDIWLSQFDDEKGGNTKLEQYGLYREHPATTPTWCHLTTRPPASGHRTFMP